MTDTTTPGTAFADPTVTDPFTVTRTAAGVVIASNNPPDQPDDRKFVYTLTTGHDVDRFLDHLHNPRGDLRGDDFLGVLAVNDQRPLEPRVATVLYSDWDYEDWPNEARTIEARMSVIFWTDYHASHAYLDLDLPAVARLYVAVNRYVDGTLPGRVFDPSRSREETIRDRSRIHTRNAWAVCRPDCYADRRVHVESPF